MRSIKSIIWILVFYFATVLIIISLFICESNKVYEANSEKIVDLIMKFESKNLEQYIDKVIESIEIKRQYLDDDYDDYQEYGDKIKYLEENIEDSIGIIEVLNYEGGENFAKIIVDKNNNYNKLLSITDEETEMNRFFNSVLENIQENGWGLESYYVGDDDKKDYSVMTYYKEYKDFNWVIITGIYKSDVITYLEDDKGTLEIILKSKLRWVVFITIFFWIITILVLNYIVSCVKMRRLYLLKWENEIVEEHHKIIQEKYDKANSVIHDFKNHLIVIKGLIDRGDVDEFNKYIPSIYYKNIESLQDIILTKNKVMDIILNEKISIMNDEDISFKYDIRCTEFLCIEQIDLAILMGNLLDNSIESSRKSKEKLITLTIQEYNDNFIVIKIINTSESSPNLKGKKLVTTKKNKEIHGYGIRNVKIIIKKYNGNILFNYNKADNMFEAIVILPKSIE